MLKIITVRRLSTQSSLRCVRVVRSQAARDAQITWHGPAPLLCIDPSSLETPDATILRGVDIGLSIAGPPAVFVRSTRFGANSVRAQKVWSVMLLLLSYSH